MAEFARQVGGDKIDVTTLISPGTEPHDYDPTPQDMAGVHDAKVFIYNGAGLEPWAEKIRDELSDSGVVVVNASEGIVLLGKATGSGEQAAAGGAWADPHVWLDPELAALQVDNIRDGLIEADPEDRGYYDANAEAFKARLSELDAAYRAGLADCATRQIVTSHQAFRYLAARYGLDVVSVSGLSPDEEPSPQKLAEVARFASENGVKYIFFETLVNPRLSNTIAREVGAETLVFNPLEGLTADEEARGEDYLSVQRKNLENLRLALGCS
jgi:zinc transport system substrate-binding protein